MNAAVMGSPFDYPLSSRFDENDAVIVLDKAIIPWENVIIYKDIEKANNFFAESGFLNRFVHIPWCNKTSGKARFHIGIIIESCQNEWNRPIPRCSSQCGRSYCVEKYVLGIK